MKKSLLLTSSIGSAAVLSGCASIAEVQNQLDKKPNIIFIFADDWGYGDLGCHGNKIYKTPNIDRMAKEGIDFTNFTVSNPVCSPSRCSVMTGQFPARHLVHEHFANINMNQNRNMPDWLDPNAPMLPRMLKKSGYTTGHFGKWHLSNRGVMDAPSPKAYGYDEYVAFNLPGRVKEMPFHNACKEAISFIKRQDKPFFVNLWLHEPHTPHQPKKEYLNKFKHLKLQERVYAAVLAEADNGIGQVLDTLKELDIDDNTIVIFSSDNGPEITGPERKLKHGPDGYGTYCSVGVTGGLKGKKRSLYAGGVRVPFIVRWPGMAPAGKVNTTSALTAVDLLPSFIDLAGGTLPEGYQPDGESIVSALKGEEFKRSKPIYWEWTGNHHGTNWPHFGIRDGKWKLLKSKDSKKLELYDIESDWQESSNLAKKHPEVVQTLSRKLADWKSTLPTKVPDHLKSKLRKTK